MGAEHVATDEKVPKSFQSGNENFTINSYGRKKNALCRGGGIDEGEEEHSKRIQK